MSTRRSYRSGVSCLLERSASVIALLSVLAQPSLAQRYTRSAVTRMSADTLTLSMSFERRTAQDTVRPSHRKGTIIGAVVGAPVGALAGFIVWYGSAVTTLVYCSAGQPCEERTGSDIVYLLGGAVSGALLGGLAGNLISRAR